MVLLTGFEGYGGRTKNPSQAVVESLAGCNIQGLSVKTAVLPVDYRSLARRATQLIDELQPKIVISLGLWPGESVIRLERVGINCADFEIPDNTGQLVSEAVAPGGAAAHLTTLPIHAIQTNLLDAGIPSRLSASAGTFLCNALLYSMLDHCARTGARTRCGFIHVPYLPAQAAEMLASLAKEAQLEFHQRADMASMSLDMMITATRLAIETTLDVTE